MQTASGIHMSLFRKAPPEPQEPLVLQEKICPACFQKLEFQYSEKGTKYYHCGNTKCDRFGWLLDENGRVFRKYDSSSAYQKASLPGINSRWDRLVYKIKNPFKEELYEENCSKCGLPMLPRYRIDNHTEIPDWYECANGHRQKIIKSLIKKHRNKLVNEYPKFVVMAIGILLFSFEIFTFGGGDYAGYYLPFVVGGILIGVSAWWLHYGRVKKEAKRDEAKKQQETIKNGIDGKKESDESEGSMPAAGSATYAGAVGEIEKEDD